MITVAESLSEAARTLAAKSDSPRLDAEVLLGSVLRVARSVLHARGAEPIAVDALRIFRELVDRRACGVPVAYLTGTREFWSLSLKVTAAVLVPRPESEILVEQALELLPVAAERSVLDLGTGSGAIALAIASERPCARITGVDISPEALRLARENSRALSLPNVSWRLGSWFEAVSDQRFDLIVANPPYVADDDPALATLRAEPTLALSGGPTGLEALASIIASAPAHLGREGWLALEHGSGQRDRVVQLLERCGFCDIRSRDDYAGLPRVTLGTIHKPH